VKPYYEHGGITIYCGDCRDLLPGLGAGSIDAVVTSPPYAEQRKNLYGGVPEEDYPAWTVAWMREVARVLKPAGSVLINIREHVREGQISDYVHRTRLDLRADGWCECDELIWIKPMSPPVGHPGRNPLVFPDYAALLRSPREWLADPMGRYDGELSDVGLWYIGGR
jgi:DNA modification methylase